jgi:hypothetical protein
MKIESLLVMTYAAFLIVGPIGTGEKFEERLGPFTLNFESSVVKAVEKTPVYNGKFHGENVEGMGYASHRFRLFNNTEKTENADIGYIEITRSIAEMIPEAGFCGNDNCKRIDPALTAGSNDQFIDGYTGEVRLWPNSEFYTFDYNLSKRIRVSSFINIGWNGLREILDTIHIDLNSTATTDDPMARLTELKNIFDAELITQYEYDKKRDEILASM